MEVKKIVEGMTAPQVAQVIDDNFKAQNKILEEDIQKQNNAIGVSEYKAFSEAEAVNVGDVRKYDGLLYECVEATTGAFDASKWKKSSFKAETEKKLSELGSKIVDMGYDIISAPYKEKSIINPQYEYENSYLDTNGILVYFDKGFKVKRYSVVSNSVYCVKGISRLSSPYPWVAFSKKELLFGENVEKVILNAKRSQNGSMQYENIEMFFRVREEGYIYVAVAEAYSSLNLYDTYLMKLFIEQTTGFSKEAVISQSAASSLVSSICSSSVGQMGSGTGGYPSIEEGINTLRFFGVAQKEIKNPAINIDARGEVTFCVYGLEDNKLKIVYSQQINGAGIHKIPAPISAGRYLAILDSSKGSVNYVQDNTSNSFLLQAAFENLYEPPTEVELSSLEEFKTFALRVSVFDMGVIPQKVLAIEESLPRNTSIGKYPNDVTSNSPGAQGYSIIRRANVGMKIPRLNALATQGFEFGIYRINENGIYSLVYSKTFTESVKGYAIDAEIEEGDILAIVGVDSSVKGGIKYFLSSDNVIETLKGDFLPQTFSESDTTIIKGFDFMFEVFEDSTIENLKTLYSSQNEIKEKIKNAETAHSRRIGLIKSTNFNSSEIPSGWTNNGFELTDNGANSPLEGGVTKLLQFEQYSDLDSSCLTCIIEASTAPNIMLTRYNKQYPSAGGFVVGFNFIEKRIILYSPSVENQMPTTEVKSFDIPFDFIVGKYVLSISNYAELLKFTIFGAGETIEYYADAREFNSFARPHDKYGVVHLEGSYTVKQISFSSQLDSEPDVLVVGDSITEGDTIRLIAGGGFENRWAGLLSKKTKTSIWAQGGNKSSDINTDLDTILSLFKPKKVIYAIGTNDGNYNTWLSNCQRFTEAFENIGAEVIYTTSVLRPAYESEHAKMRDWIKASGHRYIDFCSAMSVDGLCVTNKDLFLSDKLHPTPAGHYQMFKAVISSLPDLQW